MADTKCQLECEGWIRTSWMQSQFAEDFTEQKIRLTSGGEFKFDAVNTSASIVATISTSAAKTATGNLATGALMKLRSDMLFLLLSGAPRLLLITCDASMWELCERQRRLGRVPPQIEFHLALLPPSLQSELALARRRSSDESLGITPGESSPV